MSKQLQDRKTVRQCQGRYSLSIMFIAFIHVKISTKTAAIRNPRILTWREKTASMRLSALLREHKRKERWECVFNHSGEVGRSPAWGQLEGRKIDTTVSESPLNFWKLSFRKSSTWVKWWKWSIHHCRWLSPSPASLGFTLRCSFDGGNYLFTSFQQPVVAVDNSENLLK